MFPCVQEDEPAGEGEPATYGDQDTEEAPAPEDEDVDAEDEPEAEDGEAGDEDEPATEGAEPADEDEPASQDEGDLEDEPEDEDGEAGDEDEPATEDAELVNDVEPASHDEDEAEDEPEDEDGEAGDEDEPATEDVEPVDEDEPASQEEDEAEDEPEDEDGEAGDDDEPATEGVEPVDEDEPASQGEGDFEDEPEDEDGEAGDEDEPASQDAEPVDEDEPASQDEGEAEDEPEAEGGEAGDEDEPATEGAEPVDEDEPASQDDGEAEDEPEDEDGEAGDEDEPATEGAEPVDEDEPASQDEGDFEDEPEDEDGEAGDEDEPATEGVEPVDADEPASQEEGDFEVEPEDEDGEAGDEDEPASQDAEPVNEDEPASQDEGEAEDEPEDEDGEAGDEGESASPDAELAAEDEPASQDEGEAEDESEAEGGERGTWEPATAAAEAAEPGVEEQAQAGGEAPIAEEKHAAEFRIPGYEWGPSLYRLVFEEAVTARKLEDGTEVTVKRLLWYHDAFATGDPAGVRPMRARDLLSPIARRYAQAVAKDCANLRLLQARASELQQAGGHATAAEIPKCLVDMVTPFLDPSPSESSREPLYLVLESIGDMSLNSWWRHARGIATTRRLQANLRRDLRSIVRQVASALAFLTDSAASVSWVHHDLKPDNIFLDLASRKAGPKVKLINFDNALSVEQASVHAGTSLSTRFIRPPAFQVPDMAVGIEQPAHAYDVFSLAASLAAMLGGERGDERRPDSPYVPFFMMLPQRMAVYDSLEMGFQSLEASAVCVDGRLQTFGVDPHTVPTPDPPLWAELVASCVEAGASRHVSDTFLTGLADEVGNLPVVIGCTSQGLVTDHHFGPILREWQVTNFTALMARSLALDPSKRPTPSELLASPWLTDDDVSIVTERRLADDLPRATCPDEDDLRATILGPLRTQLRLLFVFYNVPFILLILAAVQVRYTTKSWTVDLGSRDAGWIGAALACYLVACGFLVQLWLPFAGSYILFASFLATAAAVMGGGLTAAKWPRRWVGCLVFTLCVFVATQVALLVSLARLRKHLGQGSTELMRTAMLREGFGAFDDTPRLSMLCNVCSALPLLPAALSAFGLLCAKDFFERQLARANFKPPSIEVELARIDPRADPQPQEAKHANPFALVRMLEPEDSVECGLTKVIQEPSDEGLELTNMGSTADSQPREATRPGSFHKSRGTLTPEAARMPSTLGIAGNGDVPGRQSASQANAGDHDELSDWHEVLDLGEDPSNDDPQRPISSRFYFGGNLPVLDAAYRTRHRMFGSLPNSEPLGRPVHMFGALPTGLPVYLPTSQEEVLAVAGCAGSPTPGNSARGLPEERSLRFRLFEELDQSSPSLHHPSPV